MVDSTADEIDALPGDGLCASASGACTLRAALAEANARPARYLITLPAGKYDVRLGELVVGDLTTVSGVNPDETVISPKGRGRAFSVVDGATATITDLMIRNGGSVDAGGAIANYGTLTLDGVTLKDNVLIDGIGGAVYNSGTLNVLRSTVERSKAFAGGGIFNDGGTVTVTDTTIARNHTRDGGGGGIYNSGTLTVSNSIFWKNRARLGFGGGGIYNPGTADLVNVTFSFNRARLTFGGAINNDGAMVLTNVTLSDNQAAHGSGGLVNNGVDSLHNTVITRSFTHHTYDNCYGNDVLSLGHNVENGTTCHLGGPNDMSNTDAMLLLLKNDGGPTKTRPLSPHSPLVDAGDNDGCPSMDQRHEPRPVDGNGDHNAVCDIGAYELQP